MAETAKVVISRQWQHPEITVRISELGIGIDMLLDDYLVALLAELGSPALILTREQLRQQVTAAAFRVQMGMQKVTAEAMASHISTQ